MLTRTQKEESVAELRDKFARAKSVIVADYRGLSVGQVDSLRSKLRAAGDGYEYRVAKNTLLRRATADSGLAALAPTFAGPTAVALAFGDPVRAREGARRLRQGQREVRAQGRVHGRADR